MTRSGTMSTHTDSMFCCASSSASMSKFTGTSVGCCTKSANVTRESPSSTESFTRFECSRR